MKVLVCFVFLALPVWVFSQNPFYSDQTQSLPSGTSGACMDVAAGDLDGDMDLDLVLAGEFQANVLLFNDGQGKFSNVTNGRLPQPVHDTEDIAIVDLNQDSKPDLVFVSEDDSVHEVYYNDGSGFFSSPGYNLPNSICNAVAATDLNGDGYPDLLLGNSGQNYLLINQAGAGFSNETVTRLPMIQDVTQDVKLIDIDGDTDPDLFVGNEDGNRLLINDGNGFFY